MDDSWLAKCVATPQPMAPLPAPAPALTPAPALSSIPTSAVQPQQLRRVLDSTSSDQVYMNLRHNFHSFIRQEGLVKDQARVQETAANNTLQLGPNKGKGELGNSFLALLSAEFSQLANSRMDITKLSVGNDDKVLTGNGSVVPSITIPPLPENHRSSALGNWNELSSFVGSRAYINPVSVEVPSLLNNPGITSISNNDVDFVELAPDQTCQGNHTGIAVSPTMNGWSKSGRSANVNKHPPVDVQASRIISFETMSPISSNSSILRGRPLVFCRNTVGELFMGDRGLLGVICFCHSSRMSVAKFCEHSGSSSLNPGEAVYLENGMSISHWCKENLGIIAPGLSNGWEWFGGSFTKGVLVGSKASDAPSLLNNTGSISNLGSPVGSWSSAEAFNNFLSSRPYLKVGCTAQEKSGTNVQDSGYQSYNVSGYNPLQEKIPSAMQVSMPDQTMNQFMQAMKQSPICVSPEKVHSTLRMGKKVVDHHANTYGIYHTVKCADHSVPLTPLWANKTMKHGFGIRSSNISAEAPLTDRHGASNIELRLGQPSKKSHPHAGSFPTPVFKFESKINSLKSQVQQQVKEPISNSWDAKKTRENLHFTPLEASCSNKRLVQVVTSTLNSSVNTVKHSGTEDLTRDANKNPLISLFLSHLEGNNTSLSLDNLFNSNDHFSSRMADTASTLIKSNICDSGVGSHGIERKSDSSNLDKGKNVLPVGSGRVNSDFMIKNNQTPDIRELPGPFSRKNCRSSVSGEGNQVSSFLDQPSNMLQKLGAKDTREPGKFSFLSSNDDFDHVVHESSVPVHCGSVGPDLLKGFPMNLSPTTLCTSEPNRNCFSTTQHFMDANLRSTPSRPMDEFSNQESSKPFFKTTSNHHKLCCLSSSQLQGCQDDLAMQRDSREGSYCRSHCDDSQITGRAVYSCPSCHSSCGMDIFSTHPCHAGSTRSCNCTGPVKRLLNSEKCCNRLSSCCSCDADEQPCLRLAMPANSRFPAGRKHEMFSHKEHSSCLSGHCCSSLLPRCIQSFRTSRGDTFNDLSDRGVFRQASITHATLDHDKDSLLPDIKRICLSHCDCCKNNVISRNDQQTTFWKDVPKKVFAHTDASNVKFAKALENTQNIGDQVVDCAARFSRTHQNSKSLRAKQMSNVSSGSSTPVITEISVEANKLMSCTANTRPTKVIHDFLVDEGSGNEICGSSDEAVCGAEGGDEGPHLIGEVDKVKPGHQSLEGHTSHLLDEFPVKNSCKTKGLKYVNEELAAQEIINHKQKCDRTPKAANINEYVELNRSDKSVIVLDFSSAPSELPNNIRHVEVNSYQSQGIELSPQPGSVMQSTHDSACGSSSVKRKRKRSALSLNKFNERFNNQHKLMENDDRQSLNGDCSDCIPEISREKKDITVYSKQDNFISTGKPPKYMSLNCIVNTPSNGKIILPKKSRPIVCGNSGIICTGGIFGPQKPAKMISLSLILRKARRCTEINDTAMSQVSELSSCKLVLEKDALISTNGKHPKTLILEENKACSTKNAEYLNASSLGKETGLGNNRNTKVLQKSDENKEYPSKNSDFLTSSTRKETGSGRNLGLSSHHMKMVVHSIRKQKDLRTCRLSELASKRKHATKGIYLSTSGIDECSNLIQAKNQKNDSPSTTMELEDQGKKLHPIEVKLHQSEPFESTLPTLIGSSPYPKNNQDHAGKLSQVSRRRYTRGCKCPSFLLNSDAFCCVCGSSNQEDANQLLECHDCLIRVHQACYGISKIPKGYWCCRPCKSNSQNIVCVLCGYGGGVMTRALKSQNIIKSLLKAWRVAKHFHSSKSISCRNTENGSFNLCSADESTRLDKFSLVPALGEMISDAPGAPLELDLQQTNAIECKIKTSEKCQADNSIVAGLADPSIIQWVHMVCGLWTPGTRCPNVVTMSTFDVSGALPAKKNIVCSICSRPGGSCIECRVPSCSIAFHPWCAHQKGLLQSETEGVDNEKVGFYGRCLHHATHYSFHLDNRVTVHGESPRNNEWTCARTEGFRGRQRERGQLFNPQRPYDGVCIVSQEQINAWLHINGQKSYPRNAIKSPSSDVEYDFRKEYIRYKQLKGWKHLVVYKSGIHALGLYTSQFIARGAMVVEYVGEIVGLRVADKREVEYQSGRRIQYKSACYFFRIDKEHIIDATRKGGIARFVNHSCLPNCVAKVISVRNEKKVVFFAERDINPGEEITYDYHFNSEDEGKKIPCFCNSRNCRRYLN